MHLLLGTEGGGIITAIVQWAPLLIEAGWPLRFVLLSESKAAEMLRAAGLQVEIIRVSRLGRFTRLARELAALHPAVIHCHNPSAHLMAMTARRRLHARVARTVHADMFHEMRGTQPPWKIWLWKQTMRRILPRTDLLTVVSPHLIELLPGIRGDDRFVKVMPNGFDPDALQRDQTPLPEEIDQWLGTAPVVLAMGRLVAVKNFEMLLRAWAHVVREVPEAKLILAGSGPQEAMLRLLVDELGIGGSARLIGWIDSVAPWLRRAHVVAISSRSECCPMLVFEAMAAGKAIVATEVGGIPFLVKHRREALLVPDQQQHAFAAALAAVLSDPTEAAAMGRRARETLLARYDQHVVAAQMADAYSALGLR